MWVRASPRSEARLTVVVDSREQEPYSFEEGIRTIRRALPAGDYSIAGYEDVMAIERKSLADLVHSTIGDRERFSRELRLLSRYDFACVVVEATIEDILEHRYRSAAHPHAVLGAVLEITVDHRVPVFFCGDRQIARQFVHGVLRRYHHKVTHPGRG
jgi:DNA excision repair protein ERCC-4